VVSNQQAGCVQNEPDEETMNLPEDFINTMRNAFGDAGRRFLAELPARIQDAEQRWGLSGIHPVDNLSYNYVARARRGDQDLILKIGVPNVELTSEMEALRLYDGRGACRLFECDEALGLLLIERLKPGRMLAALTDDEQATLIAAQVMRQIRRAAPAAGKFLSLRKWFEALERLRAGFDGGTGPLPVRVVETAEGLVQELFARGEPDVLLHGDFHHYNVLESERGWLVIDPKGVIGPAGYEVGPLLLNPFDLLQRPDPRRVQQRRIQILAEQLGFEREYVRAWGIAHAVLSACWSIEAREDCRSTIQCAEMLMALG
jgi:streptomycin 6-kinase